MRTFLRGKVTLLFMMLGMLLAVPAVAFAADVVSDVNADLSSDVNVPTWVGPNADKSFQIKVWAVGNYNNINNTGRTGEVPVVKNYSTTFDTATNQWKITAGTGASDTETINFETGLTNAGIDLATIGNDYHYTNDCPTTGTVPMGCQANPFVVTGKLSVGNVPNGIAISLTDAFGTAAPGFTVNSGSLDSGFVKVDAAKPTVTLTTPANNAEYDLNEAVSASYSCADSGSGIKATGGCVGTVANGSAIDTSSTGSKSFTVTATDNVGNVETVTHNYTVVNPDSVAPTSTHSLSADANGNGWHNSDVTVTLNATDNDGGSGVDEIRYSINGGAASVYDAANKPVISTEGTTTFSYFAVDNNNNVENPANSFQIKLDKTAPEVAFKSVSPAANANGWRNQDVTATFEATDSLSGMGATDAAKTTTNTATTTGEGTDISVGSPAFTDRAGNTAPADTATSPDFKIDKSKPTVSVTGVSNGDTYTTGNVPTPGCKTEDQEGLSGVKTNATVSVTGGTGGFGTLTATCSGAVDNADNNQAAPVSATYSVSAAFNGFLQPIDGHSVNSGKYGRTYPIKWQLRDSSGALISDTTAQLLVGMMTGGQKAVSCTSFDLTDTDALEESTTGNTALRYDATSDQFIYNYKAPSSGTCYVFAIRYADGLTTQQIDFKFTK